VDSSKKEINELKCQERKMLKQTELIKSALNELGCEEVPSGCDLSIDNNQTFISNSSEQVSVLICRRGPASGVGSWVYLINTCRSAVLTVLSAVLVITG
jgi:hypothetical protein